MGGLATSAARSKKWQGVSRAPGVKKYRHWTIIFCKRTFSPLMLRGMEAAYVVLAFVEGVLAVTVIGRLIMSTKYLSRCSLAPTRGKMRG